MADARLPRDKWRHGDDKPSSGGPSAEARARPGCSRFYLCALVVAGLAGILIGLFMFIRPEPKPIFLSLAVTEYADRRFPVNAYGQQDSEALRVRFGPESIRAFQSQERDLILREINQLADRSRAESRGQPIIVHLCANAFVADDTVFLVPGNAKAGAAGTCIALEELFAPLRRAEGNRLLLLDLRPIVDARVGLLFDNLAEAIQRSLTQLEQKNELPFHVIVACGASGSPVVSRELRRSAFGWFLDRGLAGEADGWNGQSREDEFVNTIELAAYVRDAVFKFSSKLEQPQLPAMHGAGKSFELIAAPQRSRHAGEKPELAEPYPEWLLAGWAKRDRWRDAGVHLRLPRTFVHYETLLLHAESQWLGGGDLAKSQREFEDEQAELFAAANRFPEPAPPVRSLAQAQAKGITKRAEIAKLLQPILAEIKTRRGPPTSKEAPEEPIKAAMPPIETPADAADAADLLFAAALSQKELSAAHLALIGKSLRGLPHTPRFAETLTLQFLTEVEQKRLRFWEAEPETIPLILVSAQLAERTVAVDGRCLPWLKDELKSTDAKRREALDGLLRGDRDARAAALDKLNECRIAYNSLIVAGRDIETALRQYDEARVLLAEWMAFEAPDPRVQRELDVVWQSIVNVCREMQPLLATPKSLPLTELQQLRDMANDLQIRRERVSGLMKVPSHAKTGDLQRWLQWPLWSAEQRRQLTEQNAAPALSQVESALQAVSAKAGEPSLPMGEDRDKAALRRARRALDVLVLADDADSSNLSAMYDNVVKKPQTAAIEQLGRLIGRQWMEVLPERYRQATDLRAREKMGWAIPAFSLSAIPRSNSFPPDAAAEHYRLEQKKLAVWIGEFRDQPDAEWIRKVEGAGAAAFAAALTELARTQLDWNP